MKISNTVAVLPGLVPMRRWYGAWPQKRAVRHYPRSRRSQVLTLIVVCLSGLASGCILPTRVGGYAVTGTVVDRCSGAPIKGVTVFLQYKAMNMFGPRQVDGEPVLTNELGKFYIPPRSVTMMGGSGGLAGETQKWPTVVFFKDGYSPRPGTFTKFPLRDKAPIGSQEYQNMILKLYIYGENCPADSRPLTTSRLAAAELVR